MAAKFRFYFSEGSIAMQHFTRHLIAAAAFALVAGCASTGETTGEQQTTAPQDSVTEQGITAQPGQDAYSYPYGQAPIQQDTYDTSGGAVAGGQTGGEQPPGQATTGGGAVAADRIVYFGFDSSEIPSEGQAVISANARTLTGNARRGIRLSRSPSLTGTAARGARRQRRPPSRGRRACAGFREAGANARARATGRCRAGVP